MRVVAIVDPIENYLDLLILPDHIDMGSWVHQSSSECLYPYRVLRLLPHRTLRGHLNCAPKDGVSAIKLISRYHSCDASLRNANSVKIP